MSSNSVIKSVAKKLKYYFEVKRLEDGFDLSDVHQPQLMHPPLKTLPAHQYNMRHDRALKHYFSEPEVRIQLTHLNSKNAKGNLSTKREQQVRKMLDSYMKQYSFQKSAPPSCYHYHRSKGCTHPTETSGILHRRKKKRNLIGGWPTLRARPSQHISKGEATRLVNSATKILAASSNYGLYPGAVDYSLLQYEPIVRKKNGSKRSITAKLPNEYQTKKSQSSKYKAYDDTHNKKRHSPVFRPNSPTPSQSSSSTYSSVSHSRSSRSRTSSQSRTARSRDSSGSSTARSRDSSGSSTAHSRDSSSSSTVQRKDKPSTPPPSAKFLSRTFINLPEVNQQEEVGVVHSTQTATDENELQNHADKNRQDKAQNSEIQDGPICEYQVHVRTGNRLGASTKAPIKLIMYGEKGRTKEFVLAKSKTNKIPFQKGKEDLFIISTYHVDRLKQIQIGHDRPELNFAWYLEGVTIYDMYNKQIFQFPCEMWLSGQDGDKKTYKILQADRERDFIDALDDRLGPTPRDQVNSSEDSDHVVAVEKQKRSKNVRKKQPTKTSSETSSSESDGEGGSSSSGPQVIHRVDKRKEKRSAQKSAPPVRQDVDQPPQVKGPVITLHTSPGGQKVDEIHMDSQGQSGKDYRDTARSSKDTARSSRDTDNLDGNKFEEDKKRQIDRERAMEAAMMHGKGIHEAVRTGDLERVKHLLHQYPEMKDFKDENGWTPLHLAAGRGNIEALRWLVTSDAEIDAETPTGHMAMHIAALNGYVNCMMLLQAMGSSILHLTKEKQTTLHLAAKSGHLECVKWLVANRAQLNAVDKNGHTALKLAEDNHQDACAEFLRVCMKELANPKSTFAQIHRQLTGSSLPPIEEDSSSVSSSPHWKDKRSESSGDENENTRDKSRKHINHPQGTQAKGVSVIHGLSQEVHY
ncbi:uncharacterized protein LOC131936390 isoform X2 [Physella acuta]|uniref:uncharacterized protein LOC131936390 isoform X2 n=1 Tax=Physella acuta TaxID=109671 RepID=UPI0027DAD596|nr:uncharacterized protein LOC131936390 isoform X2 [Physella acuta]